MNAHVRANLWLLGLTVLICCVLYPLVLWAIGQGLFPDKASGSLIVEDGKVIGSRLIAQPFTRPEYFWPRPSAVSYDAGASGGSNLSANNPKLRERVAKTLADYEKYPSDPKKEVPADLVMASGSGLDPHITLQNALYQLDRVVEAWAEKTKADKAEIRQAIEELLNRLAEAPFGGLTGVKLINVLEVNLALPEALKAVQHRATGKGGRA
ncbi:MAG TPA: potassium-transporting ATPase subunit KdpC [Gemmataceae bacterium]|nr:potassium-transporting ATPase subunit KdpC [Gemmataceae bacterium]